MSYVLSGCTLIGASIIGNTFETLRSHEDVLNSIKTEKEVLHKYGFPEKVQIDDGIEFWRYEDNSNSTIQKFTEFRIDSNGNVIGWVTKNEDDSEKEFRYWYEKPISYIFIGLDLVYLLYLSSL